MVDIIGVNDFEYDHGRGAWIVYGSPPDLGTADQLKQLHPYDTVLLYDRDKKEYTKHTILVPDRKRIMKNGKFVYVDEDAVKEY
jgi:hypothetical protein